MREISAMWWIIGVAGLVNGNLIALTADSKFC